jgi:hypothetical protein
MLRFHNPMITLFPLDKWFPSPDRYRTNLFRQQKGYQNPLVKYEMVCGDCLAEGLHLPAVSAKQLAITSEEGMVTST